MVRNRKGLAPWSLAREAGIESATVDGTIDVPQTIQPVLDTGFVDEKGNWQGAKSSDRDFIAIGKEEGIANGAHILAPGVNADGTWPLDMTGYKDLFIAIKPTRGGNYAINAVMGPDSNSFANLNPVNPATVLRGASLPQNATADFQPLFEDGSQTLSADVWSIYILQGVVAHQKLLQFKITNSSGGNSDIETAFMRIV